MADVNEHSHHHDEGSDHGHGEPGAARRGGILRRLIHALPLSSPHEAPLFGTPLDTSARGIWATKVSLAGLGATALIQVAVVLVTGSVALLADTVHNFADALTAIPLWIAFALGARGASRRFTYGYSRAEDLAGLFVVLMIVASAGLVFYEAFDKIANPRPVDHLWLVVLASIVGFAGNEAVAEFRIRVGRQIGSAALVVDGQHARADGLTSLAVLAGAAGVAAGFNWADPAIGVAIGGAIILILKDSAVEIWGRLMDGVEPALLEDLREAAGSVDQTEIGKLRARWTGHELRVEVEATMDDDLSLRRSHDLAE